MNPETNKPSSSCGGECEHCHAYDHTPGPGEYTGWRFALASIATFLLPLILASLGAILAGTDATAQFLAAIGGLLIGIVAAIAIQKITHKRSCNKETS